MLVFVRDRETLGANAAERVKPDIGNVSSDLDKICFFGDLFFHDREGGRIKSVHPDLFQRIRQFGKTQQAAVIKRVIIDRLQRRRQNDLANSARVKCMGGDHERSLRDLDASFLCRRVSQHLPLLRVVEQRIQNDDPPVRYAVCAVFRAGGTAARHQTNVSKRQAGSEYGFPYELYRGRDLDLFQ